MTIEDLFSKIGGGEKEPKVEQNEMESDMNDIKVKFTPAELNFTSLCVKTLGVILKDKPDAFCETGIPGIIFQSLSKEIDMLALFRKFEIAMLKDMMDKSMNRKY